MAYILNDEQRGGDSALTIAPPHLPKTSTAALLAVVKHPSHTPSLLPSNPFERAYARIWSDFVSKSVVPRFVQAQTADAQAATREELNGA